MLRTKEMLQCLLVFTLVTVSWQQCLTPTDSVRPVSDHAAQALLQSELRFSADLIRAVGTKQPGQNVFFSPSSIFKALLMTYFISATQTEDSLKDLLYLPADQDKLDIFGAYTLQGHYEKLRAISSTNFTLTSANRLYHDKYIKPQTCMKLLFPNEIQPANFEENLPHVVKKINHWVADQTRHVIKDYLKIDQLSVDTELIIVNAAYFKGSWKNKFDVEDTKMREFYLSNGTVVKTPTMFQRSEFKLRVFGLLNAEVLELEYAGKEISMFVMKPFKPSKTATQFLLDELDFKGIQEVVQIMNKTTALNAEVSIPKFTMDKSLDLTKVLELMGVGDLFQDTADLSTLTGRSRLWDTSPVSFSEATHQAKIRVDEEGTEAAAVTSLIEARMGPQSFYADHPFVYFLYDKTFNTMPFIGVFNSPQ